jgi:hypothetical protein
VAAGRDLGGGDARTFQHKFLLDKFLRDKFLPDKFLLENFLCGSGCGEGQQQQSGGSGGSGDRRAWGGCAGNPPWAGRRWIGGEYRHLRFGLFQEDLDRLQQRIAAPLHENVMGAFRQENLL